MSLTPPLKWHGGKHYLAARIVAMMPPHVHYVEPYFGGGSVLLAKDPEGVSEVVNDIHSDLTNFWCVLQGDASFTEFKRRVDAIPFSESEWDRAARPDLAGGLTGLAVAFFVRCRQSLAGRMAAFAPLSRTRTRRGMNEQASAWLTTVEWLPNIHARLKRVVILNRDALDVIRQQDGTDTFFYLDPPYLHETRSSTKEYGEHEMTEEGHRNLLHLLSRIEGKFMLSGYPSALYSSFASRNDWRLVEFSLPNNAAGGDTKRRMTECVWMNY